MAQVPPSAPSPTTRRLTWVAQGLGGLLAVSFLALYTLRFLVPIYQASNASDFAAAYLPAARLWLDGGDPYSLSSALYVQPVAFLALIAPFTRLPPETARLLWLVLESGLYIAGIAALLRTGGWSLNARWVVLLSLVYLSPNLMYGLLLGQATVLVFALLAGAVWALRRDRTWLAGIALGAIILKPNLLAVALPILISASGQTWVAAGLTAGGLLIVPELLGRPLLGSLLHTLLATSQAERYNKLNLADTFVNLGERGGWVQGLNWFVLLAGGLLYLALIWLVWRARRPGPWHLTPPMLAGMAAAFLWLPYSLAYDLLQVAVVYLWRFAADGTRLKRPLLWNLAALWLLPILTLALHAASLATTFNPFLILGLLGLLLPARRFSIKPGTTATPSAQAEP